MKFFLSLFALSLLLSPSVVFAEVGCRCFCGTNQGAAIPSGGESVAYAACESLCEKEGRKVIVCAADPAQYPANFPRCFTREDCASQCKERSDPKDPDTCFFGDDQPKECLSGHHYCFRNDKPYTLAYGIPEEGEEAPTAQKVVNVGEFINLVYRFLLWGGVIIAIVMIMIGGLKMVLSATTDKVKGGKDQIRNAIIGLVLLLAAGLILQTVNPQLLSLTPPKLPMLKLVTFLGEGQDCAELLKQGKFEPDSSVPADKRVKKSNIQGTNMCGTVLAIRAKEGKPKIPEGTTCTYKECPGGKQCIPNGDKSACLSCRELTASSESAIPSASTCGKLKKADPPDEKTDVAGVTKPVERNYCFYSHHPSLIVPNWVLPTAIVGVTAASILTGGVTLPLLLTAGGIAADKIPDLLKGTCAELSLKCRDMKKCSEYGGQRAETSGPGNELDDLSVSSTYSNTNLETICTQDPCGLGKSGSPCRFVKSNSNISCSSDAEEQQKQATQEAQEKAEFSPGNIIKSGR